MKRWLLSGSILVFAGLAYFLFSRVHATRIRRQHEATYEATLNSYQNALAIGVSRGEVETYLGSKGIVFASFCCADQERTKTDIVRIGQESAPWYCSESNVYVEFLFSSGTNRFASGDASDKLKGILIMRKLERCL